MTPETFAAVMLRLWTSPVRASVPVWSFIPKNHCRPFRVCCISGSRLSNCSTARNSSRSRPLNDSTINAHLAARGLQVRAGTIVDSTIISAPSSTKNRVGPATSAQSGAGRLTAHQ